MAKYISMSSHSNAMKSSVLLRGNAFVKKFRYLVTKFFYHVTLKIFLQTQKNRFVEGEDATNLY